MQKTAYEMRISDWSSDVCSSDLGAAAGDSEAAAAATKSDITASTDTPAPTIRIPVWPVARKSAAIERRRNSRSNASAVYILPTAQSAPTVINRLPGRRSNPPIAKRCVEFGRASGGERVCEYGEIPVVVQSLKK